MADLDVYLTSLANGSQNEAHHIVGRLSKTNDKHVFSYHPDSKEAISLTMPLRTESYGFNDLHPVFQMNLPEGSLREAIELATAKQYGSGDLTMLALLGPNQIGRLAYSIAGEPLSDQSQITPNLKSLLTSEDVKLFEQLMSRFAMTSGVAGVQPKVLLNIQTKATLPLDSYVVKSWGKEFPELACNEFACLTLAKSSGLDVAEFYLSDNGKMLISKRFDIQGEQALSFEDFCVLQGKTTKEKYDASLESCTNTIRQYISPIYQQEALYNFFKLTLVNIMIRNGDAHLKNSGVLYEDLYQYKQGELPQIKRQLAPMFDIVSTTPYIPNDTMALSLTGSKRWPKWKTLNQFARQHCGLNGKNISLAVDEVLSAGSKMKYQLNELVENHPDFEQIAETMGGLVSRPF